MCDQQFRNKKPRKILGNGNATEFIGNPFISNKKCNSSQDIINGLSYDKNNSQINLQQNFDQLFQQQQQQQERHQQMERLHLTNIMNQEMHAIWPFGPSTFLSPALLPAHNMGLPIATLPTYAAVPIYQGALQQCTNLSPISSSTSASTSSGSNLNGVRSPNSVSNITGNAQQISSNDSNKINIQIGLQCVSQNAPINYNSMSDSKILLNAIENAGQPTIGETGCKDEDKYSQNPSIIVNTSRKQNEAAVMVYGAGGDASTDALLNFSQGKFNEFTLLALKGSEIAEKLAVNHRNRPCFKKLDQLCSRMKQDLVRPDGVLPNINSQGTAWAVKDFIFAFTRVVTAWIIIKGYVYNTPDGLNKVKAALSPDFSASFATWQDATIEFVENLIKSFVSLENLVQSQKNVYQKDVSTPAHAASTCTTPPTPPPTGKLMQPFNQCPDFLSVATLGEKTKENSLKKNFLYTMVEDSEEIQRESVVNGTHLKTGSYTPIPKYSVLVEEQSVKPLAATISNNYVVCAPSSPDLLDPLEQYLNQHLSELLPKTTSSPQKTTAISSSAVNFCKLPEEIPKTLLQPCFMDQNNNNDIAVRYVANSRCDQGSLKTIYERIMSMKHADMFFRKILSRNYFPDFIAERGHDYLDVRSILLKCLNGDYKSILEAVHDIRKIIYSARQYLKMKTDPLLENFVSTFEFEFNQKLSEPPFELSEFEHITGEEN